jgi:hypothetical protein
MELPEYDIELIADLEFIRRERERRIEADLDLSSSYMMQLEAGCHQRFAERQELRARKQFVND